jgi:hypothetical protein
VTSDVKAEFLERRMLAIKFAAGNVGDKEMFIPLNQDPSGIVHR